MTTLHAIFEFAHAAIHLPLVRAAIEGASVAAMVDFKAFRSWQSFDDFCAYSWKTAAFRWLQGAILGLALASGFGVL